MAMITTTAGWFMNSAALLADAGYSLSGKHGHQLDTY
jgi:Co/Zn/Cd efflux system component